MKIKSKVKKISKKKVVEAQPEAAREPKSATEGKEILVSQSALNRFLECRKKARLVLDGWYPKKSSRALRYGSLFHATLEAVTHESIRIKKAPDALFIDQAVAKALANWEVDNQGLVKNDEIKQEMLIDSALVAASMKQYVKHYPGDFDGSLTWVALEKRFEVSYMGLRLMGYIDSIYEKKKLHSILETKTRSRVNPDIVDILHTDFQTFYYLHGLKLATGIFPEALVYNIAMKFGSKIKVNESIADYAARFSVELAKEPEKYFKRIRTDISKKEYEKWVVENLNPLLKDFKDWREGRIPDYCNTTNCDGKYGSCDYLPICSTNNFTNFGRKTEEDRKKEAARRKLAEEIEE